MRWQRHLNRLRWLSLLCVFSMLIVLPFVHLYQTYVAAHAYDLLAPTEQRIYDVMETVTAPLVSDPANELDVIKGTTWSGTFFGLQLSDPLAVVGQSAAARRIYWPFALTALIPLVATLLFGRFFCGWICPATLIYELNTNLTALLSRTGFHLGARQFDRRFKYVVLGVALLLSALTGSVWVAAVYPPLLVGRELYFAIALGGFGAGAVLFVFTLLFDMLVARRGFCRYLCPGGALYSLLGRYRLVRVQRQVETCNDCAKGNAICEFGLDPLRDGFGQECNSCAACIAVCPTDALSLRIAIADAAAQGPGHLGPRFRAQRARASVPAKQ